MQGVASLWETSGDVTQSEPLADRPTDPVGSEVPASRRLRPPRSQRIVRRLADLTLWYPLALCSALYGQWLASWLVLGHRPVSSLDDPKYIPYAHYLGYLTGLLLLGFVAVACASAILHVIDAASTRRPLREHTRRAFRFLLAWVGAFAWLRWDPGDVLYWWFD